ncbi:hypothetical protein [Enterovirga rhinocerotis]|nr:hypothetical protein [Enterovirga rhinocerotis]
MMPFTWGSGGERLTPEAIRRRREIANALIKGGSDYSPIGHWTQGIARVAQALVGGYEARELNRAEGANAARSQELSNKGLSWLYGGGSTPSPDVPAAGASPVSLDPTAPVAGGGGAPVAAGDNSAFPTSLIGNESGGRWNAQNGHVGAGGLKGHFGRLQFGQARLQEAMAAGVMPQGTTPQQFMASPELQQAAERWHFGDIDRRIAGAGFDQLIGQNIGGVPVTLNGMRAAAHLGGFGGLTKLIQSGGRINARDANKTSLLDYMRRHGAPGGVLAGSAPQQVASGPIQDDPSVPSDGPGVPLGYNPAPSGSAAADASRVAADGGPRMVLSPQNPLFTPQQAMAGGASSSGQTPSPVAMALANPRDAAAGINWTSGVMTPSGVTRPPNPGDGIDWTNGVMTRSSPAADMPAEGARPVDFVIPPARPGGELTTVPSSGDQANTPAAGAQPVQQQAQPSKVAQALVAQTGGDPRVIAEMISSPYVDDATKQIGMLLLQQRMQSLQKDKPDWGVISKDDYGREQYGWIDKRRQAITPYNASSQAPSGPSAIPPAPPGVDPKAWRDAHSKQLAEGSATGNFDQETKLRSEFGKNLGTFADVHDAFGRVIASTQGRSTNPDDKSPAADIALVFGYMKMLDPGSVVREGEYATAKNAGGIPERVQNTYNQLLNGEFLTPKQRQDFVNQAQRVYGQARKKAEETAGVYRNLSKGYQVDANRVVTLPEALQAPVVDASATAQPGASAPTGSPAGSVARPTTQADFDRLPRGAVYVDPDDGKTYRKQ